MTQRQVKIKRERWPLRVPFRITGKEWIDLDVIVVHVTENGHTGRGEAAGVFYIGEDQISMESAARAIASDIERGLSRAELQDALGCGGARNAVDCALWDLECKLQGKTIWERLNVTPRPVSTVATVGILKTPKLMAQRAAELSAFPTLKIKLDGEAPVERVEAIRAARPEAELVIDANQGFTIELLCEVVPHFERMGVAMIEQPLKRGEDEELEGFVSSIPICADESVLDRSEFAAARSRYDMINIKLDKTGGLTEALALLAEAKSAGMECMVGNMLGTSLAMAPAIVVAQHCAFCDLDGPIHLSGDRLGGILYDGPAIAAEPLTLWG
ncbi:MAG: dipeptide epimerase [Pseudomonadota bacterium]